MGPQRDVETTDDPARSADSIESLLRSTDRDTEEIVDALRESGPRQHVSETDVDEILTDLSEPQPEAADDEYALSGGPTRTVSTSGIDEVFDTLEAEAPSLPPEPQVDASGGAGGGDSGETGFGGAATAMAADSASGTTASVDRSGSTAVTFDPTGANDSDDDAEPFGSLVGGEPTRTVADESVDDILETLEDESPDQTAEGARQETDESVDDLRPNDPEGELVDLLAGAEPDPGPTAEPGSSASTTVESGPDEAEAVESVDDTTRIDDAAAKLARTDPAADSGPAADSPAGDASGAEFAYADPALDTGGSEPSSAPTVESDATTGEASRPLVTRAELEEIAGLVSGSEPTDDPGSGAAAGSPSEPKRDSGRDPDAASGDEDAPESNGASTAGSGSHREAVSVDADTAPTGPVGPSSADDRSAAPGGRPKRTAAASGAESTDPPTPGAGSDTSSLPHRIRILVRRLVGRMRR